MKSDINQTERTKVKRIPKRGAYDRETINSILDEAFICHVGFSIEDQPFVIPTAYGRKDDLLYLHGSAASRMMREMSKGIDVSVAVTLTDAFVLAHSAFHHSINYRSVVIFGKARVVSDAIEKSEALKSFTNHLVPGRWDDSRLPSPLELKATTVLKLPIEEASAKLRTGGPVDDIEDLSFGNWTGIIPLDTSAGKPIADLEMDQTIELPNYLKSFDLKSRNLTS